MPDYIFEANPTTRSFWHSKTARTRSRPQVMWLLGRLAPDHKTIADFRKDTFEIGRHQRISVSARRPTLSSDHSIG
jgi:hypothetical protein